MKEIAHCYVAEQAIGKKDSNLYIGSFLPDLEYYTVASEELMLANLHEEGSEKFYYFLRNKVPKEILLSVGMLSHGTLYGADYFSDVKYRAGPGYTYQKKRPLIDEVEECSQIPHEVAVGRAHNFIELGLDFLLLQKEPDLVERVSQALTKADLEKIAEYLSDCFQKDKKKILAGLRQLFSCFRKGDLNSLEGLTKIWAKQAAGLPERDRVNVTKSAKIIEKAACLIKEDYKEFLRFTVSEVRRNLKNFINF